MTSSLGLINLLEQFIELKETFYLLDYQFTIKEYNLGTARWKRCTEQGMGKGHRASMPSLGVSLSPHLHVFTTPELLSF